MFLLAFVYKLLALKFNFLLFFLKPKCIIITIIIIYTHQIDDWNRISLECLARERKIWKKTKENLRKMTKMMMIRTMVMRQFIFVIFVWLETEVNLHGEKFDDFLLYSITRFESFRVFEPYLSLFQIWILHHHHHKIIFVIIVKNSKTTTKTLVKKVTKNEILRKLNFFYLLTKIYIVSSTW